MGRWERAATAAIGGVLIGCVLVVVIAVAFRIASWIWP